MKKVKILFGCIIMTTIISSICFSQQAKANINDYENENKIATSTVTSDKKYKFKELKEIQEKLFKVWDNLGGIIGTGIDETSLKLRVYVNILDGRPVNEELLYQYVDKDSVIFIEVEGGNVNTVAIEDSDTLDEGKNEGITNATATVTATATATVADDKNQATSNKQNLKYTFEELQEIQEKLSRVWDKLGGINGTGIDKTSLKLRVYVNILDGRPVNKELLYQYVDKDSVKFIEDKGGNVDTSAIPKADSTNQADQLTSKNAATGDNSKIIMMILILSGGSVLLTKRSLKLK